MCVLEAGTSAATPVPSAERVCSPVPTRHRFAVVALPVLAPPFAERCAIFEEPLFAQQWGADGAGTPSWFWCFRRFVLRVLVRDARRIMCTSIARAHELGAA